MGEKEYNVVTWNDGIEYTEVYRLTSNGNTYSFLSDLDNIENFCIKKVIKRDGEEIVIGLDNEVEFNEVLALFAKEYLS